MDLTPSRREVEDALAAIVKSVTFAKAPILRDLLIHLVRHALSEEMGALNEKSIGNSVLQRREDFQPSEDSLVRKTMGRLRDKLMTYYASDGRSAEVRIVLERGSYRPAFVRKQQLGVAAQHVRIPRILVLQFHPVNFHDSGFFTDGLQEDLMIALAAGGGMPIVPWTTSRYLRERSGDLREYYRVTEADIILDGTVRQIQNGLLQITISWVDGLTSVFDSVIQVQAGLNNTGEAVQSICEQVTRRIGLRYTEEAIRQVEPRHSHIPEARGLFLRARQANRLGTAESTRTSFAYLERALKLQPDYAAAHALKANTHIYAGVSGLSAPRDAMQSATDCAQRALWSAPQLASAFEAKGGVQFAFDWDFEGARRTLGQAREMDPTSDFTHFWTEAVTAAIESPPAAARQMEAHAEDDSCSAATAYLAAAYCYNAEEWKRAERWAKQAIELDQRFYRPYPILAGACLEMGKEDEALAYAEQARRISGPNSYTTGMLGFILARTGRVSEARRVLKDASGFTEAYPSSIGKAVICAGLGETEQALEAMEQMIEDREPYAAWLHLFPFFSAVRADGRFEQLMKRRSALAWPVAIVNSRTESWT